jgi:cytochrome c biogenesis protein CcmG, thiol:disulfide interchange protein DsbE
LKTTPTADPASRHQSAGSANTTSRLLFGGAVLFVIVAGVAAVVLSRTTRTPESSRIETAPITVVGTLPAFPDDPEARDPAKGMAAPTLTGQTPDKASITVPTPGRRTLLVVVAHWCPHCQREVPRLVKWQRSGAIPPDLDVVFLSTAVQQAQGSNYPPSAWLEREGVTFPVIVDDEQATGYTAYGALGFPNLHLIGADGTVIARTSGELDLDALSAFVSQT